MHRPYKEAVILVLPKAKIVIDRFHVIQLATKALEKIRVNLGRDVSKSDRRYLVNSRFILLKNQENFRENDFEKMDILFNKYPNYGIAYNLKESFRKIYECNSKKDAIHTFKEWEKSIPDIMPEFKGVAKTMNNWSTEIFNYFDHRYTNAYTESLNNLIKEIEKRGRGYSFEVLRAKVHFGTTATKPAKYSRPERRVGQSKPGGFGMAYMGYVTTFGEYEKPILIKGSGVDINELIEIMESGAF
jgi:transposase